MGLKRNWRLSDESPAEDCSKEEREAEFRESVRCKVFMGFTSNLVSSGVRDTIRYLVEHHMVSAMYTSFCLIIGLGELLFCLLRLNGSSISIKR